MPLPLPNAETCRALAVKIPTQKTPGEKAKRNDMFTQFDPNNNGWVRECACACADFCLCVLCVRCDTSIGQLSLAEVDKGIHDILGIKELYSCKPAIIRAFNAAKGAYKVIMKLSSPLDTPQYMEWYPVPQLVVLEVESGWEESAVN